MKKVEAIKMLLESFKANILNGFDIDDDETFDAITSRHSYTVNEFLMNPASVCES